MREVPEKKKEVVASLVDTFVDSPVVAIARIDGIPAPQMQKMRAKLRGKADLVVGKNRLINMALLEASEKKKELVEEGICAPDSPYLDELAGIKAAEDMTGQKDCWDQFERIMGELDNDPNHRFQWSDYDKWLACLWGEAEPPAPGSGDS